MMLLSAWETSQACSCALAPSVEEAYRISDAVLEGTVVAVDDRYVWWRKAKVWILERFGHFIVDPSEVGWQFG